LSNYLILLKLFLIVYTKVYVLLADLPYIDYTLYYTVIHV